MKLCEQERPVVSIVQNWVATARVESHKETVTRNKKRSKLPWCIFWRQASYILALSCGIWIWTHITVVATVLLVPLLFHTTACTLLFYKLDHQADLCTWLPVLTTNVFHSLIWDGCAWDSNGNKASHETIAYLQTRLYQFGDARRGTQLRSMVLNRSCFLELSDGLAVANEQ